MAKTKKEVPTFVQLHDAENGRVVWINRRRVLKVNVGNGNEVEVWLNDGSMIYVDESLTKVLQALQGE